MSELAIRLDGVSKSFKRFRHPGWRALDALGIKVPRRCFDVFVALKDVDLEVKKGERVAIIGRNGAGKSTLLRLISGQMKPDEGRVIASGKIQALMELGSGFHPDFSGLENIKSSLSLQGLTGHRLRERVDEIVDFTELEGFIERPVREYSAGMYARLAFAVATSIEPEILIVDEILGAGDAYFVGKSIQRMKALTQNGATVLFVSHDMSSVQMLCDRAIWLDAGKVREDGHVLPVSKAYLAAVREDEEQRIRARSMALTRQQVSCLEKGSRASLFRLIGEDGEAPEKPVIVGAIRFGANEDVWGEIRPENPANGGESDIIMDDTHMNWKGPEPVSGRQCWLFGDFGGVFGHAPWRIQWPERSLAGAWLELEVVPSIAANVAIEQYDEKTNKYVRLGIISQDVQGEWKTIKVFPSLDKDSTDAADMSKKLGLARLPKEDQYGTGEAIISSFGFLDAQRKRRHTLITGEKASAVLACSVRSPIYSPVAVVAVYRPDGVCAMQVVSNRDGFVLGEMERDCLIEV
ncbi:ATP-binding cassette domain-containing protein, partial [Candidatus Parcubacteria bacterium]